MANENKEKLIVISGPTAVGKTSVSVKLAKKIGGEIISADSMQVYRGLDIGTAKITKSEMQGVPHHLIDICDPKETFDVTAFKEKAKAAVLTIRENGHIPIVVGGTGYYIQALLYDIDFTDYDEDESLKCKEKLEKMYDEKGALYMHEYLKSFDPVSANIIHMNNKKKLIHAILYKEMTGTPISQHNASENQKESPYDFSYFVLIDDRQKIYERIDKRVDIMFQNGLVDEVKKLRSMGLSQEYMSMLGISYKEIDDALNGIISMDEAARLIKRDSRRYAKKQFTWFKREKTVRYLDRREFKTEDEIVDEIIRSY